MHDHDPETTESPAPAEDSSQAAARTRTADPFITSEGQASHPVAPGHTRSPSGTPDDTADDPESQPERPENAPSNCPTCGSPSPDRHPATQFEGEVQPCPDGWHDPVALAGELNGVDTELIRAANPAAVAANPQPDNVFEAVRDFAVQAAQSVLMIDLATIEQAITEAERALALGPILNPTLARDAGNELAQQLRLIRQLHRFRLSLEGFRPDQVRA